MNDSAAAASGLANAALPSTCERFGVADSTGTSYDVVARTSWLGRRSCTIQHHILEPAPRVQVHVIDRRPDQGPTLTVNEIVPG